MTEKKNVFGKIKDWWKSMDQYDRDWLKVVGVWFVDGIGIGVLCTAASKNKKMKQKVTVARAEGYLTGKMDTYREIIQDPYFRMNQGMNKLEKQGKATRF